MERRLGDFFCNCSGHFFHLCKGGRDGRGVACNGTRSRSDRNVADAKLVKDLAKRRRSARVPLHATPLPPLRYRMAKV